MCVRCRAGVSHALTLDVRSTGLIINLTLKVDREVDEGRDRSSSSIIRIVAFSPSKIDTLDVLAIKPEGIVMSDETTVQFTFGLDDPNLEDEERLKFAKKLLPELRNLDEVERADRAEDLNPEAGSKPGFATLVGFLTAEVSIKNIKAFSRWLGDRVADKPIKVKVKVGDKEVEIEAKSRQELAELEKTALNLMAAMGGENSA